MVEMFSITTQSTLNLGCMQRNHFQQATGALVQSFRSVPKACDECTKLIRPHGLAHCVSETRGRVGSKSGCEKVQWRLCPREAMIEKPGEVNPPDWPWIRTCQQKCAHQAWLHLVARAIRSAIRANHSQLEPLFFIARQADSHKSLEFPIRANHPIRAYRANRFARITPLSGCNWAVVSYSRPTKRAESSLPLQPQMRALVALSSLTKCMFDLLVLRSWPPFTGVPRARAGKCPPKSAFGVLVGIWLRVPQRVFEECFWHIWGSQKPRSTLGNTLWGTLSQMPKSTPKALFGGHFPPQAPALL